MTVCLTDGVTTQDESARAWFRVALLNPAAGKGIMAFFKRSFINTSQTSSGSPAGQESQPCSAYWPETDGEGLKLRSRNTPRLQT